MNTTTSSVPASTPAPGAAAYPFRALAAWAVYDWACAIYSCIVLTMFTPVFFQSFWYPPDTPEGVVTWRWGLMNGVVSAIVAVAAPFLGAIADRAGIRQRLLLVFAGAGMVATASLAAVARGQWQWAAVIYVISGIGYAAANIFCDALLVQVAAPNQRHRASAYAYGLGALGGGIFLVGCVVALQHPAWFGLTSKDQVVRGIYVATALWWAAFTIPLALWVKDLPHARHLGVLEAIGAGGREVLATVRELRHYRTILLFLAAYWLYIDGVGTIIRMAVEYGKSLNFGTEDMLKAVLLTQFVGFPAALGFAWLGPKIGAKRAILAGIAVYIVLTIFAFYMTNVRQFYILAATVGLVMGGVQALSRSLYSTLIPADKASEFFGLYNLLGKFAAILGPLLMGGVALLTNSARLGILSVILLFIAGGTLLLLVPVTEGRGNGTNGTDGTNGTPIARGGH